MPLQLRKLMDYNPEEEKSVYRLMGRTRKEYLQAKEVYKFMKKHNFSTDK